MLSIFTTKQEKDFFSVILKILGDKLCEMFGVCEKVDVFEGVCLNISSFLENNQNMSNISFIADPILTKLQSLHKSPQFLLTSLDFTLLKALVGHSKVSDKHLK